MSFMDDTSPEAKQEYYEMLANKSPAQRSILTQNLSKRIRLTSLAGIRRQHPNYSENEVKHAYLRRITTDEEFNTLFPDS